MTGGRMCLGIGAGWKEDEWLAYGYAFPCARQRLATLEEQVQVITSKMGPGRASFHDEHASLDGAINVPKPVQEPRAPIMVGGNGPYITWRLAARSADKLNLDGMTPVWVLDDTGRKPHLLTPGNGHSELVDGDRRCQHVANGEGIHRSHPADGPCRRQVSSKLPMGGAPVEHAGRVVAVTGSGQGTGMAIADAFAREGATVVVSDINPETAADTAARIAGVYGVEALAWTTDVADPRQCADLISAVFERFGGLDVLVNCAGIFSRVPAVDIDAEEWSRVFDVCLHGAFYCSREAARRWMADDRPGVIVNISSTASTHSSPGTAAYSAAKAGLSMLTRALGVEWAPHHIRVNAVAPSHINVERLRQVGEAGILDLGAIARSVPMGRIAEPEEVADAVLFLAGDKARFVTSQVLFVDGGFSVPPIYRYEQS